MVIEKDLPLGLENESIVDFRFDADCYTSFDMPAGLPANSEAPIAEVLPPIGI